ncbi:anthranilate synthase component II [Faecalibaculum rodentium]|uniref:anthranilate synthase component II n=1 Tax=Faecalibaculum rodentium TaxID=1702221 RepID=UPI0023F202C0|nr:aminodeoxychorismate/anthranilate synthase component II [Faecalibaculum rodentium]
MILLIDNYDSFTWNLVQMTQELGADVRVVRNDRITVDEISQLQPTHILLSPGPGKPADAGITLEVVRAFAGRIPLFGVCLGHQAICEAFGATVAHAPRLMHGKASRIRTEPGSRLFAGLPPEFSAGRYHSLAAREDTLPPELVVTARSEDGQVMAVEHESLPVFGVQFHPESILTPLGKDILAGFLKHTAPAASALPGAHTTPQEGEPA